MSILPRPESFPDWTVGNPNFGVVTVEPESGKKVTGFTPGEAPTIQDMNWLFYNLTQWAKYLDSVSAQVLANGIVTYVPVDEVPTGTIDGSNLSFVTSQAPISQASCFLIQNSRLVPNANWNLSGRNITFVSGQAPQPSDDLQIKYVTQIAISGAAPAAPTGTTPRTEYRVLTTGEATAKQLTLLAAPTDPNNTDFDCEDADTMQFLGIDYTVAGAVVSWGGLGLDDGSLVAGSKVKIRYFI